MTHTTVAIEGTDVVVRQRGLDRVWCFRARIAFPLSSVRDVRIETTPHHVPTGWRGPGLDYMGKLCGTFHPDGQRHFWNYSGHGDALEIVLDDAEDYQKLSLSVDDPGVVCAELLAQISRTQDDGSH
jgi:hypothetical protein